MLRAGPAGDRLERVEGRGRSGGFLGPNERLPENRDARQQRRLLDRVVAVVGVEVLIAIGVDLPVGRSEVGCVPLGAEVNNAIVFDRRLPEREVVGQLSPHQVRVAGRDGVDDLLRQILALGGGKRLNPPRHLGEDGQLDCPALVLAGSTCSNIGDALHRDALSRAVVYVQALIVHREGQDDPGQSARRVHRVEHLHLEGAICVILASDLLDCSSVPPIHHAVPRLDECGHAVE